MLMADFLGVLDRVSEAIEGNEGGVVMLSAVSSGEIKIGDLVLAPKSWAILYEIIRALGNL
jgi:hypothetical protein